MHPMARWSVALVLCLSACKPRGSSDKSSPEAGERAHRAETASSGRAPVAQSASASAASGPAFAPAGSPIVAAREVELALYLDGPVPASLLAKAKEAVAKAAPGVSVSADPTDTKSTGVAVWAPPISDFAPPTERELEFFGRGLTPEQRKVAAASKGALVMDWKLDGDPAFARMRLAHEVARDLAKSVHAFVWDDTTRELFSVDDLVARRIEGSQGDLVEADKHFVIHYYQDEGRHRAVTLGLSKLGLPDLVVADVPPNLSEGVTILLDAAAQELLEGRPILPGGKLELDLTAIRMKALQKKIADSSPELKGSQKGTLTFVVATPEKGDADNRLWELRFDGYPGATEPERQAAALTSILGKQPDKVTGADKDDPELAAVTARVQAKLGDLRRRFKTKKPSGRLSVKAPFTTDSGGVEWMWVEVTGWGGPSIQGTLANDPDQVKSLKLGAKVVVKESAIADYLWDAGDGKNEGGESVEILMRREKAAR